jgi:hypothetical protein
MEFVDTIEPTSESRKEINLWIESLGEVEEVLLLSNCYVVSDILLKNVNIAGFEEDKPLNGGWWYDTGWLDKDEDVNVLYLTDGVVKNYFLFVKNVI